MRRENETFLTYKNLRENRERLAKKELDRINLFSLILLLPPLLLLFHLNYLYKLQL